MNILFTLLILALLVFPSTVNSEIVGKLVTTSDCSTYIEKGVLCIDSDDGKFYKGTGTGIEEIGAGGAAFPSGTKAIFFQSSCPTGWTQDTTHNDKALRIVSGTGGGTGGTRVLSSANVGDHTLTVSQIPAHSHQLLRPTGAGATQLPYEETYGAYWADGSIGNTGGGGAHNHPLGLAYIDVIICTKD